MSPKFIFFIFSLFSLQSFAQKAKNIVIHCDVLGKKNETVRYYHPVEGLYHVVVSDYVPEKKVPEFLKYYYAFIDPRTHLTDSLNHIQANSLRHYIDPADLVYVEWKTGHDTSNITCLNDIKNKAAITTDKKYQDVVEDYFKPFYFRKGEVTNGEYREFVYWVRDSIFKEAIFASGEFEDDEMLNMLAVDQDMPYYDEENLEWITVGDMSPEKQRQLFSFKQDYNFREELDDYLFVPIIAEFYHPQPERYRRWEINVTKLQYRYFWFDENAYRKNRDTTPQPVVRQNNAIRGHEDRSRFLVQEVIGVYPDTSSWEQDYPYIFTERMAKMYFWNPAYDNYPVVGVSREQALAFLNWKQQKLEAETGLYMGGPSLYEYALPTVYEYEWAISHQVAEWDKITTQDNELVTSLLTSYHDGETGPLYESLLRALYFTERVYEPFNELNKKHMKEFLSRVSKEGGFIHSDRQKQMMMRYIQNWLPGGICFLSNNVSEWMSEDYKTHYEKLFEAYVNYNCFANPDYCEDQRNIDIRNEMRNDSTGYLIMGGNWYDERYETILGVNAGGLYPKTFRDKDSSYATVGFRYVIRPK